MKVVGTWGAGGNVGPRVMPLATARLCTDLNRCLSRPWWRRLLVVVLGSCSAARSSLRSHPAYTHANDVTA